MARWRATVPRLCRSRIRDGVGRNRQNGKQYDRGPDSVGPRRRSETVGTLADAVSQVIIALAPKNPDCHSYSPKPSLPPCALRKETRGVTNVVRCRSAARPGHVLLRPSRPQRRRVAIAECATFQACFFSSRSKRPGAAFSGKMVRSASPMKPYATAGSRARNAGGVCLGCWQGQSLLALGFNAGHDMCQISEVCDDDDFHPRGRPGRASGT